LVYPVLQHRMIFRNREAYRTALKSITDPELDRLNKLAINR
jgi:hypothetical protein